MRPKAPWFIALQLALAAGRQWSELPPRDRERLRALLAKSKGLPTNLSAREREELRRIARKLDLPGIARDAVLPFAGRRRTRGLRRR